MTSILVYTAPPLEERTGKYSDTTTLLQAVETLIEQYVHQEQPDDLLNEFRIGQLRGTVKFGDDWSTTMRSLSDHLNYNFSSMGLANRYDNLEAGAGYEALVKSLLQAYGSRLPARTEKQEFNVDEAAFVVFYFYANPSGRQIADLDARLGYLGMSRQELLHLDKLDSEVFPILGN